MVGLHATGTKDCPTRRQLEELSRGLIRDDLIDVITAHAEACPKCESILLEQDALPDHFLQEIRATLHGTNGPDETRADPHLESLLARAEMSYRAVGDDGVVHARDLPHDTLGGGARIGDYFLLSSLGQGGMGRVFKARHEPTGKIVAIKILNRDRFDRRSRDRFRRELTLGRQIDSPNVVQVLDSGEIRGEPYLVMEHLHGHDLAGLVAKIGALSVADACEIVRQAALAVGCCHEHGILHRDVKPSNLMLTRDGAVKVLDLGLARRPLGDETEVTQSGQVLGTADYLAPEQGLDARDAGPHSDVYSLGCTLYFLLCGRPPFDGHETFGKKLLAHVNAQYVPLRRIRDDVSPRLARLVDRMLAKDPSKRVASCSEVAAALRAPANGADPRAVSDRAERPDATVKPVTPIKRERHGRRRWNATIALALLIGLTTTLTALLEVAFLSSAAPESRDAPRPAKVKRPKGWQSYTYKNEGFSADFPAKPEKTKEGDPKEGVSYSFAAEQAGTSITYVVMYDDLKTAEVGPAWAKVILRGVADELKKMTKAKKDITLNGHPGIELRLEFEQDGVPVVIHNRVILVKRRLFQVMVSGSAKEIGQAKTEHFFESFKLLGAPAKKEKKKPKPVSTALPIQFSGELAKLDDASVWPSYLDWRPTVKRSAAGLISRNDTQTVSGAYLDADFTYEVTFDLMPGDGIVCIGLGESRSRRSLYLRAHHERLKSGVGLAKSGQIVGCPPVGDSLPTGTHRAIITKVGNAVTFAIDVHNDGDSANDMEISVPDLTRYVAGLNETNVHLFFGGGGTFKSVKLTFTEPRSTTAALKSDATYKFAGRSPWPPWLSGMRAVGRDGLERVGRDYLKTKAGDYLSKDFQFDVVFSLSPKSSIGFVGLGEGVGRGPYVEPGGSLTMRIHHKTVSDGVGLAKNGSVVGNLRIGPGLPTGTHRAYLTKKGKAITFGIDVDNDGPTANDVKHTVRDVSTFAPYLDSKRTHLFFGGGGTFKSVRISN